MTPSPYLPVEIIDQILDCVPGDDRQWQLSMAKACLVNKSWYAAAVEKLYRRPILTIPKYPAFVRTVAPSRWVTGHHAMIARDFGALVEVLDLRHLSFAGEASETARLIGRCKKSLRVFTAPICPPTGASSFGNVCFVALGNCRKLEMLDLSLVGAERWPALQRMLRHLPALRELSLPSTGHHVFNTQTPHFFWPPVLDVLELARCMSPLINALARPSAHYSPPPPLTKLVIHEGGEWNRSGEYGIENEMQPVLNLFAANLVELTLFHLSTSHLQVSVITPDCEAYCPQLRRLAIQDNAWGLPGWPAVEGFSAHPLERLTILPASGQDENNWKMALLKWPGHTDPLSILRLLRYGRLLDNLRCIWFYEATRWAQCVEEEFDGRELIDEVDTALAKRAVDRNWDVLKCGVWDPWG